MPDLLFTYHKTEFYIFFLCHKACSSINLMSKYRKYLTHYSVVERAVFNSLTALCDFTETNFTRIYNNIPVIHSWQPISEMSFRFCAGL